MLHVLKHVNWCCRLEPQKQEMRLYYGNLFRNHTMCVKLWGTEGGRNRLSDNEGACDSVLQEKLIQGFITGDLIY